MKSIHTRSTSRRSIFVLIPLVLIVVILTGIFGGMLLNSEWFVNYVQKTASDTIGHEVTIGSLRVNFGKSLQILIKDVAVKNPEWAKAPHLAAAETIAMGIDTVSLLGGNLVMTHLRLDKPSVHLEQSSDDRSNWHVEKRGDVVPTDQTVSDNQSAEGAGWNWPRVESLGIEDGIFFTYHDPTHDTMLDLSVSSFQRKAHMDYQDLLVEGGGEIAGESLSIELTLTHPPVLAGSANTSYPLSLHVNAAETSLVVEGKVDSPISPERVDLRVHLEGRNLTRWNSALGIELPKLPSFEASGQLYLEDGVWALDPMRVVAFDSDISGTLWLTPHASPPLVEGVLSSQRFNIVQLQDLMPEQEDSVPISAQVGGMLALLADMPVQAALQWRAGHIDTKDMVIRDAEVDVKTQGHSLEISPLSGVVNRHPVKMNAFVEIDDAVKTGTVTIRLETSHLLTDTTKDGTIKRRVQKLSNEELPDHLHAELVIGLQTTMSSGQKPSSSKGKGRDQQEQIELESASLNQFHAQYTDSSSHSTIVARLKNDRAQKTSKIIAKGHYRDTPVDVSLLLPRWESVRKFRREADLVPLAFDLSIPHTTVSLSFSVSPAWPPERANVRFSLHSDAPAQSGAIVGFALPSIKPLTLRGTLLKEAETWKITNLRSLIGNSPVKGQGILKVGTPMQIKAQLASSHLDLSEWMTLWARDKHTRSEPRFPAGIGVRDRSANNPRPTTSFAPWLKQVDGRVRITVEKMVLPTLTMKKLSADISVVNAHLNFESSLGNIGNGRIQTIGKLALANSSPTGRFKANIERVNLTPLLKTLGNNDMQLGKLSGQIALRLPPGNQAHATNHNKTLLDRLRVEDVHLRYDDPHLQAKTDLRLRTDNFESNIRIEGQVEYQDIPVDVSLTTGSLRQAIENYQALPVDATLHIRETTAGIEGKVGDLFPLESLTTSLRLAGPDLFRFGEAINIPMPHLPPYDLHAEWQRTQLEDGRQISLFENLEGTIGDSDVTGTLRVTSGGERPMIFTRLQSRKLDLDDLAGLTGAPPDPEETASAKQKIQAKKFEDRDRLLPAKPLDFTKLQNVDVDLVYRAKRVQAPDLPIDDFLLKMNLQDGHMRMNRLDFGVANGKVAMKLEVNARHLPVQAKLTTDFDQVNLRQLLGSFEMADDSFGDIGGRATLWMNGASLAEWFASADGGLYLTMTGGKLDGLLVELAGLDFAESTVVFLNTDKGVNIDCAYADLQARSGHVTISPFLVDTKDTKFKATGIIDLRQEQVDLTIKPYPKDFSLLSSRGPLDITGPLIAPNFNLNPSFPSPEFATADDSVRCENLITLLRTARKSNSAQLER